ncbi:Cargo-transport protein [Yarrowia sp. B02]|nr:Cargo-transport protein [Yarrowia sp. B02]
MTDMPSIPKNQLVSQLDEARTLGNLAQVPSLVQKIHQECPEYGGIATVALEDTNLVTLFLDHNVSDYLSPTSAIPVDKLEAIQKTLQSVNTSNFDPEELFFYNLALAHTDLLLREPKEVVSLLNDISEIDAIPSFRYHYTDIGLVRRAAILGTAFEVLGEIDQAISVYASTSHLINDSIGNSPEALVWAERLYYRNSILCASQLPANQEWALDSLRSYGRITDMLSKSKLSTKLSAGDLHQRQLNQLHTHLLILNGIQRESGPNAELAKESKETLQQFEKLLDSQSTTAGGIPKATDSNTAIEGYTDMLVANWRVSNQFNSTTGRVLGDPVNTLKMLESVRRGIEKTYHSRVLMRSLVAILAALGHDREALASFEVYMDYEEHARIKSENGVHEDIDDFSIIEAFSDALRIQTNVYKDGNAAKKTADRLLEWLSPAFHHRSQHSQRAYGRADYAIGRAYSLYALSAAVETEDREKHVALACKSFKRAVQGLPAAEPAFDYAYLLAKTRQTVPAIEVLRNSLAVNTDHVESWHLLALLLSAVGDFQAAIQVTVGTLDRFSDPKSASLKEKLIELKMTEIAIREADQGLDAILPLLKDVFALFGAYFGAAPTSGHKAKPSTATQATVPSVAPTQQTSSSTGRRFSKVLRRKKKEEPVVQNGTHATHTAAPAAAAGSSSVPSGFPTLLHRILWLWAAAIYRRAGLVHESEQAIVQAESVDGPTASTRIQLSLLMKVAMRPQQALEEVENALETRPDSLASAIALSSVIIDAIDPEDQAGNIEPKKPELDDEPVNGGTPGFSGAVTPATPSIPKKPTQALATEKKVEKPATSLFISDRDKRAALARVTSVLESVTRTGNGFDCAEAWWLLSRAYEIQGNVECIRDALWQSVKYEEARPVRNYSVCI